MKKLILLLLTLSMSFAVTAFAATEHEAQTPVSESVSESTQVPDGVAEPQGNLADEVANSAEAGELADAAPVKEKFTILGFTVSNIITTALVAAVFVTGVVTKKMGKW